MQQPTCTNTRIRSTSDAQKIFLAVQRKILPKITRRLDADERASLKSGCVYAWEERGAQTDVTGLGIERFTEGRRWSPSRVRDVSTIYCSWYLPMFHPF
jgi:Gti1/Pac2 family transcription factor